MRKFIMALAIMLLAGSPAMADEAISLKVGYMSLSPSGQFAGTVNGVGTRFDVEKNLGLDNSKNVVAEAALLLGDFELSAAYLPLSFSGVGTVTGSFGGQNFAGTVSTDLNADVYDFGLTYFLVNMDDLPSRFQLGIEVAVKYIQFDSTMTDGVNTSTVSQNVPLPTVGARMRVALADFIGVTGRVGYLGFRGNQFLDAEAQVEFSPIPTLGIYGGYRYVDLKVDEFGVFADTKFQGPFAGAFFRF